MSARKTVGAGASPAATLRRLIGSAARTSRDAGSVAGASRRATCSHLVASEATDDDTLDAALDLAHTARLDLAAAPAAGIEDVETKVAHLVKTLLLVPDGAPERETETLALAAGALADLVLLRMAPEGRPPAPRTPAARVAAIRQAAERRAGL